MYETFYEDSPVGRIRMTSDGESLTGLWIEGQSGFAIDREQNGDERKLDHEDCKSDRSDLIEKPDLPVFVQTKDWLNRFFSGQKPQVGEIPLAPAGSPFRQEVWSLLCEIPWGQVVTYGDIAKKIKERGGKPHMSAQAVGGAVGHNPISIVIPCHRVVGGGGNLTGYGGGLAKKIRLLELEGVDLSGYSLPKNLGSSPRTSL
ncbi:MAG: methylated-DNA--[Lachnospiraceae bacterium]|nr:methylated-DNA--[protein]-cysteine S-methyltransferase [Lachnospiraceae bacterium]